MVDKLLATQCFRADFASLKITFTILVQMLLT